MKKSLSSMLLRGATWLAAALTFLTLLFLIAYILIRGIPHLRPSLFELEYNTRNVSLLPALITTVMMVGLSLAISVPLGLFTAIFLVEYAKKVLAIHS